MPRLHHTIVIERATAGARGERGGPAQTWAPLATIKGLVQPLTGLELAQLSQAGPVASTHRLTAWPTDLLPSDRLVVDGERYQVTRVAHAGGAHHHIEAYLQLVQG